MAPQCEIVSEKPSSFAIDVEVKKGFTDSILVSPDLKSALDPLPSYFVEKTGSLSAIFSGFLSSINGLMVSLIIGFGAEEIFGFRCLVTAVILLPILVLRKHKWRPNWLLVIRSLIGTVAVIGYFFGFATLPLAEASLLYYSTPLYTIIIGWLFMKEKCSICDILCLILCLSGVALVCLPSVLDAEGNISIQDQNTVIGVASTLAGAVFQAIDLVLLRKLGTYSAVTLTFWWAIFGLFLSLVMSISMGTLTFTCQVWADLAYMFGVALIGVISQMSVVWASYVISANKLAIALTFEIVCAFAMQVFVQGLAPTAGSISGAVLIGICVMIPSVKDFICKKCCFKKEKFDLKIVKSPESLILSTNSHNYGSVVITAA